MSADVCAKINGCCGFEPLANAWGTVTSTVQSGWQTVTGNSIVVNYITPAMGKLGEFAGVAWEKVSEFAQMLITLLGTAAGKVADQCRACQLGFIPDYASKASDLATATWAKGMEIVHPCLAPVFEFISGFFQAKSA